MNLPDLGSSLPSLLFQLVTSLLSGAVIWGMYKTKIDLLEKRQDDMEHKMEALPEVYVTQAMFRDFMQRMDSGLTEVRQDIKELIRLASKK